MFSSEINMNEVKNIEHFLEGIEAAMLENEFKNYKTDFVYRDRDFGLGYNLAKRQYDIQKQRVGCEGFSLTKTK